MERQPGIVPRFEQLAQIVDVAVHDRLPAEKLSCPTFHVRIQLQCRLGFEN